MLAEADFSARIQAAKKLDGTWRRELEAVRVLASTDDFAVAELVSGQLAACWTDHATVAPTLEDLLSELNSVERALLRE